MQGKVDTHNLTKPQLEFTISVMAMVMDKLIQDDMLLDEKGKPAPIEQQENDLIKQAMMLLNYK